MRPKQRYLSPLALAFGIALGLPMLVGCGGDDGQRRRTTIDWQPSDRLPITAAHWWWDPVERYCEEDNECEQGEHCRRMRLSTCPTCPPGQDARVCIGDEDGDTFQADYGQPPR